MQPGRIEVGLPEGVLMTRLFGGDDALRAALESFFGFASESVT
jgi:hypothetical protein